MTIMLLFSAVCYVIRIWYDAYIISYFGLIYVICNAVNEVIWMLCYLYRAIIVHNLTIHCCLFA